MTTTSNRTTTDTTSAHATTMSRHCSRPTARCRAVPSRVLLSRAPMWRAVLTAVLTALLAGLLVATPAPSTDAAGGPGAEPTTATASAPSHFHRLAAPITEPPLDPAAEPIPGSGMQRPAPPSTPGGEQPTVQLPVVLVAVATSVDQVLTNIRNWLMGILALLATVAATWGGIRYVMAGGDPGEVEKAKSALRSAAIGYVLAALAPLVVSILQGLVSA